MSESSWEFQEPMERPPADYQQSRKDRLNQTFIDKLSKVNLQSSSIYDRKKEKTIRGEACIYRIPEKVRQVKEDAYEPSVVSIGPFHEKDRHLPMTEYKLSYMLSFLNQQSTDSDEEARKRAYKSLKDCIHAIVCLDEVIRQCYADKINYEDEDALTEMMILDGCFILELFLRFDRNISYMAQEDYNSDPVLRTWTIAALRHDLALLENQIPFCVLADLYATMKPHVMTECKLPDLVTGLALNFFQPMSCKEVEDNLMARSEPKHLLDLLCKFYIHPTGDWSIKIDTSSDRSTFKRVLSGIPSKKKGEKETPRLPDPLRDSSSNGKWKFDYCTSALLNSGIELQVGSNSGQYLHEIKFERGVIIIPQLYVHENSDSLLRNLIAFERCSLRSAPIVTSYTFLLKSLITTPEDIKLLRLRNIIRFSSRIGDEEFFAQFQSILDEVDMKDEFCFHAVCDQVQKYKRSFSLCRHIKSLNRTHFSTAWSIVTFIAAIFAFILSILQTYFTINPR